MPLRGYKALGNSARQYRTPSGKVISRREYDNKRAQSAGFRNRYELEQFRTKVVAKGRWSNWVYDVKQRTGRLPTFGMYGDVKEVRERRRALQRKHPRMDAHERDKKDRKLVAPDGPLARILDASGRRPLSGRPVGDS